MSHRVNDVDRSIYYSSGLLSRAAPRLTLGCVDQWMALSTHIRVATGILLYLSCVVAALPTWSPCFESRGPIDRLISAYFYGGHKYRTILQFLLVVHGYVLSMRQLKRKLKRLGLRRQGCRFGAMTPTSASSSFSRR